MSEVDIENHLSCDEEDDKAQVNPSNYRNSIIPITIASVCVNVAKGDDIELLSRWISLASGIDREQNGPSNETADKGDDDGHLEVAQQEEGIERVLLQDYGIGNVVESLHPAEHALGQSRRALLFAQSAEIGSRSILAGKLGSEKKEAGKEAKSDQQRRNEG